MGQAKTPARHDMEGQIDGRLTGSLEIESKRVDMGPIIEFTIGCEFLEGPSERALDDCRLGERDIVRCEAYRLPLSARPSSVRRGPGG